MEEQIGTVLHWSNEKEPKQERAIRDCRHSLGLLCGIYVLVCYVINKGHN